MSAVKCKGHRCVWSKRGGQAVLAAISCVGLAGSAYGAATTLFADGNGAVAGLGAGTFTFTWSNINTDTHWATSTAGTTAGPWVPGDIAAFNTASLTVRVSDVISVGGLVFNAGGNSGTTPNLTVVGAGPWALDFGSNNFSIVNNTNTKQIIAVPIRGSGDMTVVGTATGTAPIDLACDLSQFTGNIIVNNGEASPSASNANQLQLDSAP